MEFIEEALAYFSFFSIVGILAYLKFALIASGVILALAGAFLINDKEKKKDGVGSAKVKFSSIDLNLKGRKSFAIIVTGLVLIIGGIVLDYQAPDNKYSHKGSDKSQKDNDPSISQVRPETSGSSTSLPPQLELRHNLEAASINELCKHSLRPLLYCGRSNTRSSSASPSAQDAAGAESSRSESSAEQGATDTTPATAVDTQQSLAADPKPIQISEALSSGNLAEAQQMINQVLKNHPQSPNAHFVSAQVNARVGNLALARRELAYARILSPGLPFASQTAVQELENQIAILGLSPISTQK